MRTFQRARKADDKELRSRAILDAVRALAKERPFSELTMAQIADRAGLAKGTVFLYFATKEACGLALTELLLSEWFDALTVKLSRVRAPSSPERLAHVLAESVTEQGLLVSLLGMMSSLERNVPHEGVQAFKEFLLARQRSAGERIERLLPRLAAGSGGRFLVHLCAFAIGFAQLTAQAPSAQQLLVDARFASLKLEGLAELEGALRAQLEGLTVGSARATH